MGQEHLKTVLILLGYLPAKANVFEKEPNLNVECAVISVQLAVSTAQFSVWLCRCTQIRDFGLQHICGMRNLHILSVAGNHFVSQSVSHIYLSDLSLYYCLTVC